MKIHVKDTKRASKNVFFQSVIESESIRLEFFETTRHPNVFHISKQTYISVENSALNCA